MNYLLLKRLTTIVFTICFIIVAAFALLRMMPGDPVRLKNAGYSAQRINSQHSEEEYKKAYYNQGLHLPVFYFSLSNMAVPDSFYYLPDKNFREALIRLSLLSGSPTEVYAVLKKDSSNSWSKSIAANDVNLENIANYYRLSGYHTWHSLQSDVKSWRGYIPILSFNTDNQFHRWLFGNHQRGGVLSGEFGVSSYSGRKVWDELKNPMKITTIIALFSLMISVFISVILALWLSSKGRNVKVNIVSPLFLALYSLPVFWVGTWLLYLFANPSGLQIFPASGYYRNGVESTLLFYVWLLLPVFCNSFSGILFLTRLLTEGFSVEDKTDYTRTALSKGVSFTDIRRTHQLKNLVFPALAVIAGSFPVMMNGSVLIEQIFSIPGLGSLMIRAVQTRDIPMLSGFFLITGLLTILVFQLIDLMARMLDPRIRIDSGNAAANLRQ